MIFQHSKLFREKIKSSTNTTELNIHSQILPGHPNISFVKASFSHLQFLMSIKEKDQNKEKISSLNPGVDLLFLKGYHHLSR